MSGYPCSEQAYESSTHTPETEQQERNHQTPSRHSRPVYDKISRITGNVAHQEGFAWRIRNLHEVSP